MSGPARRGEAAWAWLKPALGTVLLMGLLAVAGGARFRGRLGERGQEVLRALSTNELNKQDATLLQRGYYENLMGAGRFNSQLYEVFMRQPPQERFRESVAARATGDFLDIEMVPNVRTAFQGMSFSTNRWGMRDRDYQRERPPGAYRLAIVGASITMGWGVADGHPFDERLEARLNASAGAPYSRYEVLNFAVAGYSPPQQLLILDRVLGFDPQTVLFIAHEVETDRALARISGARAAGLAIPLDSLERAARWAWAGQESRQSAERRLHPHRLELLGWTYREFVRRCRERGVAPVWVFLPTLDRVPDRAEVEALTGVARQAGFVVVSLADVYDGVDRRAVRLGDVDRHPNPAGHELIGAALARRLWEAPELKAHLPLPADGERIAPIGAGRTP